MTDIDKKITDLTIKHPFLFAKLLEKYPHLCQQLLEKIFNLKISDLNFLGYENILKNFADTKNFRTDIYVQDKSSAKFFTIEMQNDPTEHFGKKMRYYNALMGKDSFQRVHTFADIYIVFICPFNPFKEGHHLYTVETRCMEDPSIVLDDGVYQIFLCTESQENDVPDEIRAFLDYVGQNVIRTDFVKTFDNCVQEIKSDKKFQNDFSNFLAKKS